MIICLTCFLLSITEGQNLGWLNKKILCLFFVAVVSAFIFYIREMSIKFPIVDFKIFNNKTILFGDISLIFCYMAMTANTILFPFYTQHVLRYSAVLTAIAVLPYALANIIFAPVAGKLSGYIGSKYLTLLGGSLIGFGIIILIFSGANALFISLIITQFIIGTGSAFFQSPSNNAIMAMTSLKNSSTNSGIIALSRNIGMTVGVAIATTVFAIAHDKFAVVSSNPLNLFIKSYHSSLAVAVIFAFTCAFLSFYAFKHSK
jgi:MFS family permease